jgi:hypothetical protein
VKENLRVRLVKETTKNFVQNKENIIALKLIFLPNALHKTKTSYFITYQRIIREHIFLMFSFFQYSIFVQCCEKHLIFGQCVSGMLVSLCGYI